MARKVRYVIADEEVDLTDAQSLGLVINKSISDISDIGTIKKSTSKSILLPGTKQNLLKFRHPHDENAVDPLDQKDRPASFIEVGGTKILEGHTKVNERIRRSNGVVKAIRVVLIGDNGDWKERAAELSLQSLDLSDQDHIYNKASIDASETVDESRIYVYPLINYGKFDGDTAVSITDRFPAIQVQPLMKKIFNGLGIKIDGDFVDDDLFKRLYLPFTEEVFKQLGSFRTDRLFRSGLLEDTLATRRGQFTFTIVPFNDETTAGFFDTGGHFDTNIVQLPIKDILHQFGNLAFEPSKIDIFFDGSPDLSKVIVGSYIDVSGASSASNNGYFKVIDVNDITKKVRVENSVRPDDSDDETGSPAVGDVTEGTMEYVIDVDSSQKFTVNIRVDLLVLFAFTTIRILKNGVPIPGTTVRRGGVLGIVNIISETPIINFLAGDRIRVEMTNHLTQVTNPSIDDTWNLLRIGSFFSNDVSRKISPNQEVPLAQQLPDWTQLQFVENIRDACNLFFDTSVEARKTFMEPRDSFYKNTNQAIDWTLKEDQDSPIEIKEISGSLGKDIIYSYASDGNDAVLQSIQDVTQQVFGSVEFTNPNQFARGESIIGPRDLAPTLMDTAPEIGLDTIEIPKLWKDNPAPPDVSEKSTNFMPRLLYYNGVKAIPVGQTWDFEGDTRSDYPNMLSIDDVNDSNISLNFVDGDNQLGLFNRFYKGFQVTSDQGFIRKSFFNLTDRDVANIDFRIPIFVKDSYYFLQRIINYKIIDAKLTAVELLKAIDIKSIPRPVTVPKLPPDFTIFAEGNSGGVFVSLDGNGNLLFVGGLRNTTNGFASGMLLGSGLSQQSNNQILMGKDNIKDADAQLIIGGGDADNKKNLMIFDKDGSIKPGGGGEVVTTINDVTTPMYYTAEDGTTQIVNMSKPVI